MTNYRRNYIAGGTFFFTVNIAERQKTLLVDHISNLRLAFKDVLATHRFNIDAIVILPDHIHAIWTLDTEDKDFSTRWKMIKAKFSRKLPKEEMRSESRMSKGERGIWQRRFWEHAIRDEEDYQRHMDYIHFNPVKHGLVDRCIDWPYSSFHRYVNDGIYSPDWGVGSAINGEFGELE